jgi:hypothetical protein
MSKLRACMIALGTLASIGCGNRNPLRAELVGLPPIAMSARANEFLVQVRNTGKSPQLLPPREIVTGDTGFVFVRETTASPGDGAINRRSSVNWCPPSFDTIQPGETREYAFSWTPGTDDYGAGILHVQAPAPFPPVPPQPLTIIDYQ